MSILSKIKNKVEHLPHRLVIAGPEGIGKTTFAAAAPNPLFICAENGLTGFDELPHFEPETFTDVLALCDELQGQHDLDYETIVIDTADWIERLIHIHLCKLGGVKFIEDYAKGFGKGHAATVQELSLLLSKLDAIRSKHKVGIVITSHVQIRTFNDPTGVSWDRYEMKGNKSFTGVLREWPDACLFCVYEVFQKKSSGSGKDSAIGGERVIHTTWSPAHDAKNRMNLPETLPLSWDALEQAIVAGDPAKLVEKFMALLETSTLDATQRKIWTKVNPNTMSAERLRNGIAKLQTLQA